MDSAQETMKCSLEWPSVGLSTKVKMLSSTSVFVQIRNTTSKCSWSRVARAQHRHLAFTSLPRQRLLGLTSKLVEGFISMGFDPVVKVIGVVFFFPLINSSGRDQCVDKMEQGTIDLRWGMPSCDTNKKCLEMLKIATQQKLVS